MSVQSPTQAEVEEVLQDLDEKINITSDRVTQRIDVQSAEGEHVLGRAVQRGSTNYNLLGVVGQSVVKLQASFDIAQALAADRIRADGGQPEAGTVGQVQVDEYQYERAKNDLRDAAGDELPEIRQGLVDRLSEPAYALELTADDRFTYGFTVSTDLHPYHQDVPVSRFSDRAQGIASLLIRGREYVVNEYDVHELIDSDQDGSTSRGFQ
jgi:hypothetical protein